MLTPQEVAQQSFGKATFNGYNMAAVDDFLDVLTADYETLFNENALLKQKLGVLSGKIREYQSTEEAMRKTLLTAQQMADDMLRDAESKKATMVHEAELQAKAQIAGLRREIEAEQARLAAAREVTAAFVAEVRRLTRGHDAALSQLDKLIPPPAAQEPEPEAEPAPAESAAEDIEQAVIRAVEREAAAAVEQADEDTADDEDTRDLTPAADKYADLSLNFGPDAD